MLFKIETQVNKFVLDNSDLKSKNQPYGAQNFRLTVAFTMIVCNYTLWQNVKRVTNFYYDIISWTPSFVFIRKKMADNDEICGLVTKL